MELKEKEEQKRILLLNLENLKDKLINISKDIENIKKELSKN